MSAELAESTVARNLKESMARLLQKYGELPDQEKAELRSVFPALIVWPAEGDVLQPTGRARKVSVSMPEDLTTAVQERVGRGEFSRYVTEAVKRQLELDLLADLSALLEAEHGPVSEELLAEARAAWPDSE